MMCWMKHASLLAASLLLAACTPTDPNCATLPNGGHYCLQASNATTIFSVQQKVDAHFQQHNETLIADIETDTAGMQFVALTPFGQKIWHVTYDNKTTTALRLPDARLQPAFLLAILQLALWPEAAVQRGLSPQYSVQESATERHIMAGDEVVVRISHDASPAPYRWLKVNLPSAGLDLDMQTLNTEAASDKASTP